MKFIKEMILRKHRTPDEGTILDSSNYSDDESFENSEEEDFDEMSERDLNASLASIQAKLQNALDRVDTTQEPAEPEEEVEQVTNFTDIVADRKLSKPVVGGVDMGVGSFGFKLKPEASDAKNGGKKDAAPRTQDISPVNAEPIASKSETAEKAETTEKVKTAEHRKPGEQAKGEQRRNGADVKEKPVAANPVDEPQIAEALIAETPVESVIDPTDVEAPKVPDVVVETSEKPVREKVAVSENKTEKAPAKVEVSVSPKANIAEKAPESESKIVEVPAPAAGRAGRRAGRVKTRLLGFEHAHNTEADPFENEKSRTDTAQVSFPVGWIVVVEGPGRGMSFSLFSGVSQIGRGEEQTIRLDFGDTSISRNNHAAIAYDNEQRKFFLGHGGKTNLVRLNDKPVLSTEEISDSDLIRIGETTLRFVALCGDDFKWETENQEDSRNAAIA